LLLLLLFLYRRSQRVKGTNVFHVGGGEFKSNELFVRPKTESVYDFEDLLGDTDIGNHNFGGRDLNVRDFPKDFN
jgi:hypothetical protein